MNNNINDIVDYIINRFERGGKNDLDVYKRQQMTYGRGDDGPVILVKCPGLVPGRCV